MLSVLSQSSVLFDYDLSSSLNHILLHTLYLSYLAIMRENGCLYKKKDKDVLRERERWISEWLIRGDISKNKKQSEGGRERRWMVWDDKGSEAGLPP
jgi:hypothetical protein